MRVLVLGGVLLATLAAAAPAGAGCWATVGISTPPAGIAAGETWAAEITILQHGEAPLPREVDERPTVTIVNAETGASKTFAAREQVDAAGTYVAHVVFPAAGVWSYEVYDGFDNWNGGRVECAKTHTFGSLEIDGVAGSAAPTDEGGGSGFPMVPVAGGVGGLLAALGLGLAVRRRGPRTAPSA